MEWLSANQGAKRLQQGAKRLQVARSTFVRIAEVNYIQRQRIPGLDQVRHLASDVDRVAAASLIVGEPARMEAVA